MRSKWYEIKPEAIRLRKKGNSLKDIREILSIPLPTLSGWFKDIKLTKHQAESLRKRHNKSLSIARIKANDWHHKQKENRLKVAELEADETLLKINDDFSTIELALALLYLGEGFKKNGGTGMGNSDPLLLKFFLKTVVNIYKIDIQKIRFDLHLRGDQNPELMKKYWANELGAPINRFLYVSVDKRTLGRPTYPHYKGVCIINCGNVAIQRKLIYIGRKFCKNIINKWAVSSAG